TCNGGSEALAMRRRRASREIESSAMWSQTTRRTGSRSPGGRGGAGWPRDMGVARAPRPRPVAGVAVVLGTKVECVRDRGSGGLVDVQCDVRGLSGSEPRGGRRAQVFVRLEGARGHRAPVHVRDRKSTRL